MPAGRRLHLDPHAYLGTELHHRIKKYSKRVLFEPQRLRCEINELVAHILALCKESQENLFEARDILLLVPLECPSVRTR